MIHLDGQPSEQKSVGRSRRSLTITKSINSMTREVDQITSDEKNRNSTIYKKLESSYRPPPSIWMQILDELRKLGWDAHQCSYQSDTHIAQLCSGQNTNNTVVVANDSDYFAYEGIKEIIMPVGKAREYTLFSKEQLLLSLELPSERHLLVAVSVTKNDYVNGVLGYGIQHNLKIVRSMDIGQGERVLCVTDAIKKYIEIVDEQMSEKAMSGKASNKKREAITIEDFRNSISAFAMIHEDPVDSAVPDSSTQIVMLLRRLECHKMDKRAKAVVVDEGSKSKSRRRMKEKTRKANKRRANSK